MSGFNSPGELDLSDEVIDDTPHHKLRPTVKGDEVTESPKGQPGPVWKKGGELDLTHEAPLPPPEGPRTGEVVPFVKRLREWTRVALVGGSILLFLITILAILFAESSRADTITKSVLPVVSALCGTVFGYYFRMSENQGKGGED
jgi:hypothetical protein